MHRNALRRAFKPPNFVDKPRPEKSKVHESQGLTTNPRQTAAQDVRISLQPVKRRKLLVCPVLFVASTPSSVDQGSSGISAINPGKPVAFTQATASPARITEEQTDKGHSGLGITAEPGKKSSATGMPQFLPEVQIEQSLAVLGTSITLPGQLAMSGPCAIPSGGVPLLDCNIIHRIQAALIPKQLPQTAEISVEGLHDALDRTMSDINRSECSLPGQWPAHGEMAGVTMPKVGTPQKPAATSPALSSAQQGQCSAAMTEGAQNVPNPVSPDSTPAEVVVGREQLAGPPVQQAGGRKLVQRRLNFQQARPVSLNSPGAAQRPAARDCDGLHSAILTQLELQDEEMEEVFRSPEKQLGEVMRHPASLLGITLDMAFLKSVCNV